jgi:chromosome segregation ATPase
LKLRRLVIIKLLVLVHPITVIIFIMMPSNFLSKIRTRRLVKAAEARSGLKHEKAIFRERSGSSIQKETKSGTSMLQQQPTLTMTFSEDSVSNETMVGDFDETVSKVTTASPVDQTPELATDFETTTCDATDLVAMKESYECRLQENEAIIQQMTLELDRVRQDSVDVVVDFAAKEHEIANLTRKVDDAETELSRTKLALSETKEKLVVVSAALMQTQRELFILHEQNERNVVVERIASLGKTMVGYWK